MVIEHARRYPAIGPFVALCIAFAGLQVLYEQAKELKATPLSLSGPINGAFRVLRVPGLGVIYATQAVQDDVWKRATDEFILSQPEYDASTIPEKYFLVRFERHVNFRRLIFDWNLLWLVLGSIACITVLPSGTTSLKTRIVACGAILVICTVWILLIGAAVAAVILLVAIAKWAWHWFTY